MRAAGLHVGEEEVLVDMARTEEVKENVRRGSRNGFDVRRLLRNRMEAVAGDEERRR